MPMLPNPPDNTCFGCGPANPHGLHLAMEQAVEEDGTTIVRCRFVPGATQTGWPGLMHTGLHFTVLYDLSYWAALTFAGRVMVSKPDIAYTQDRLPRVAIPCTAVARRIDPGTGELRIRAATINERGRECGVLVTEWKPVTRGDVERWGVALPDYLLEDIGD